ncbi:MAG: potassium transporter TrkG [Gammaproteobacteria bacterium]|jgi:trk system potassium uptake protein TrkH
MAEGATTLAYPVRLPVIGRYLSQLGAMLAVLTLPAGVMAFYSGEILVGLAYALIAAGLLAAAWGGRRLPVAPTIQSNEAMAIVGLTFVVTPVLMAVPLAVGGLALGDALFEAVSAITTTGLSTLDTVQGASSAFLFERAWLQWVGGLGISVLSVALLMGHHAAARRLTNPISEGNLVTTARTQARQVLTVYVVLTLLGTLALFFVLGNPFLSLVNMLSTLSTGGFSPFDASIAALPAAGAWIVTVFSLIGAVPLLLYHQVLVRRPGVLVADPELQTLLAFVLLVATAVSLSLWSNMGWGFAESLRHGFMLGTSAQTTAGFSSVDVGSLDSTSKLLLMVSMLIGGGSGSTAGGIKLLRLLIIVKLLQHFLRRAAMPPHAVTQPQLSGQVLERTEIEQATLIGALFVITIGLSWLAFVAFGYAPLDALFEVTSAIGTVGLSTGITGAELEWPLRVVLCVDMLLGRLEAVTLLVILYPATWMGKRAG